jgi:hypothetical protein
MRYKGKSEGGDLVRVLHGAVAAPIIVGLLIVTSGCADTIAAAPVPTHTGAPSTTTATSPAPSRTGTSSSTSQPTTIPTASASATVSATASAAFPGIWDITSWPAYRAAQAAVEQGHQPWLLDPESVVAAWAAQKWTPAPAVHQIGTDAFQVTAPGTDVLYTIRGTRPDPSGPAPIWVITSITHS